MTKQNNITKIEECVERFIKTRDEDELRQIVQELVNVSSFFRYEHKWRDAVMKDHIIPLLADMLLVEIPKIAAGVINPQTDSYIAEALDEFKALANSTIDT